MSEVNLTFISAECNEKDEDFLFLWHISVGRCLYSSC